MQTVQFQCGSCGKIMAVGVEYLGRQVRCPHCQSVVVAPSAAQPQAAMPVPGVSAPTPPQFSQMLATANEMSAPAPAPFPAFEPAHDADSIFAPSDDVDDLFGGSDAPRLEMPARPSDGAVPPLTLAPSQPLPGFLDGALAYSPTHSGNPDSPSEPNAPAIAPLELSQPSPRHDPFGSTPAFSSSGEENAASHGSVAASADGALGWMNPAAPINPDGPPTELMGDETNSSESSSGDPLAGVAPPAVKRRSSQSGGWFIMLVFAPLISYAILATIAVVILWNRLQTRPVDPREFLPDVDGDSQGIRPGKQLNLNFKFDNRLADAPLPESLRVPLGQKMRIGDLEVTPFKVERKIVRIFSEGRNKPEPLENPSLVLHLHLKNVASDYAFTPLDNYFDRHFGKSLQPPLTQLEIGRLRLYGGPAHWAPRKRSKKDSTVREWVEGRKNVDDVGLLPGKEMDTIVCTDELKENTAQILSRYKGPLLWRVHLRRGVVYFKGARKSATAVIGVEFHDKDIIDTDNNGLN